jgi:hypothetical protein
METQTRSTMPPHRVVTPAKSVWIQIVLVIFLGPLGLFYSTLTGALVMLCGVPVLFGVFTTAIRAGAAVSGSPGAGAHMAFEAGMLLALSTWWIGSFIWGTTAVTAFNRSQVAK